MKTEKQLNALMYAIEIYPKIGRTKLMKFVFLVDLFRYNQTGDTLLEDEYLCLPNGPVPDIGFSYTDNSNAHFSVKKQEYDAERIIYQYTPLKEYDRSLFSEDDTRLFDAILKTLKQYRTLEISDFTHRFRLWKESETGTIIPKANLRLDDYEYEELESFINYTGAVENARRIEEYPDGDYEESVPPAMIDLQFRTMCGGN
ncbi:MAG: hypothetical protein PWP08_1772 [Methanofollis sp.]|nr:hypothetical protein [Methanofollis sp.]